MPENHGDRLIRATDLPPIGTYDEIARSDAHLVGRSARNNPFNFNRPRPDPRMHGQADRGSLALEDHYFAYVCRGQDTTDLA